MPLVHAICLRIGSDANPLLVLLLLLNDEIWRQHEISSHRSMYLADLIVAFNLSDNNNYEKRDISVMAMNANTWAYIVLDAHTSLEQIFAASTALAIKLKLWCCFNSKYEASQLARPMYVHWHFIRSYIILSGGLKIQNVIICGSIRLKLISTVSNCICKSHLSPFDCMRWVFCAAFKCYLSWYCTTYLQ